MAEEEVPATTEKVLKIQRVFINHLDTYSSGNIGKVSGAKLALNPQGVSPASLAVRSLTGEDSNPSTSLPPGPVPKQA